MILTANDIQYQDQLLNLLYQYTVEIYEDVQGSKIFIRWDGENWSIKPKKINHQTITQLELTVQKFYHPLVRYLKRLPARLLEVLPPDWWFCLEYFPDQQPANIKYDLIPENNLILTCIVRPIEGKKNKWSYDYKPELLEEFSELLQVSLVPYIFRGRLSERQIYAVKLFLDTSPDDLELVFGGPGDEEDGVKYNFTSFFYRILQSEDKSSYLMFNTRYQDNLERLLIRFVEPQIEIKYEILNPLYRRWVDTTKGQHTEIYSLLLLNFMEFYTSLELQQIKLDPKHDLIQTYMLIMENLILNYLEVKWVDINNFKFEIPEFFRQDKFRVGLELVQNPKLKQYLKTNRRLEYFFKIIVTDFQKPKKKGIGLLTDLALVRFNDIVAEIKDYIRELHGGVSDEYLQAHNLWLSDIDLDEEDNLVSYQKRQSKIKVSPAPRSDKDMTIKFGSDLIIPDKSQDKAKK